MMFYKYFPNWKATDDQAIKGYEILKLNGKLNLLSEIRSDILFANFGFTNGSELFFGKDGVRTNFFCKQFLFTKLITIKFNKAVLASVYNKKNIFYPIPPLWQGILINNGVHISKFWCTLAYLIYVIGHLLLAIMHVLKTVAYSFKVIFISKGFFDKPYSYFFDINESSLDIDKNILTSKNILSWYMRYKGNQELTLMHQVKQRQAGFTINNYTVSYNQLFLSPFNSLKDLGKFIFWALRAVSVSTINLLSGNWLNALFLKESALLAQVNFLDKELLAKDFLFNNSSSFYRPLWTYCAEKKGAEISFYFYSIPSFNNITETKKKEKVAENCDLLSWSKYFVWNVQQEEFVRKFVGSKPEIIISGSILLSDSSAEFDVPNTKCISVFDIQPYRDDFFKILGLSEEYHIPDIAIKFLQDINTVLSEFGITMLHKRKRDSGDQIHPKYIKFISESECQNIISISPEISAIKVINKSIGVISMPFTSTAFLESKNKIPSVFYDPTGLVCKNNFSTNGILVINGISELREWVNSISIRA